MSESLLDTSYETELRLLILLRAVDSAVTCEYLAALDTLTVNAKTLGVGDRNLNGDHRFAAGELEHRLSLVNDALKDLALRGLVAYKPEKSGTYILTRDGRRTANAMTTAYSKQLAVMVQTALKQLGDKSEECLFNFITEQAVVGGDL
ncbi:hypothetical protein CUU80_01820 [Bifidobacterium scaligerum]|uniref:Uncharacterized protein n=2 Tax=Bifidobacterium scaligerum TaxID=2052656 RepID=A0A2M9HSX2_9BIFI|nr:hypothetical protein CUU80_01820 [Bifidobacterium scaligerum]